MKTTSEDRTRSKRNAPKINPEWKWHYQALVKLRERLMSDREVQKTEATQRVETHSLHQADSATDEFDRDVSLAALSAEQDALYEVEQALKRIEEGTYGICELTHVPISPERLKALPWTRFTKTSVESPELAAAHHQNRIGPLPDQMQGFSGEEESGETTREEPNDQIFHPIRIPGPPKKKV